MADFEEMLACVQGGPGYRYTTAQTEPHVPIGWRWRPPGTSAVKELPGFPDALVEWAIKEFESAAPVRSLREMIEALWDLQSGSDLDARSRRAETKTGRGITVTLTR